MYHFVYLTRNLINNKIYVGVHSCENLSNDKYLGSGKDISTAIIRYGKQNFERHILYHAYDRDDAYEVESWIVDANFIKRTDTYNLTPGGRGGLPCRKGTCHTDETKELIKEKRRLQTYTDETKKRISEGNKGKKRTQEQLANYKKPKSEETRRKMSEAAKNRTAEHYAKGAEKRTGKSWGAHTDETKQKMSNSHKGKKPNNAGKPRSKEAIESHRETMKKRKEVKVMLAISLLFQSMGLS